MSAPIFWIAAARTRAAPAVSSSPVRSAGSETRIASSAPMASACLSASLADSGPMHSAVTVLPLLASLCWRAPSTAYSSNGLITSGASPHEIVPPSALTFASESGTCLIQAMIFKRVLLHKVSSLRRAFFATKQSYYPYVRLLRAEVHCPRNDGQFFRVKQRNPHTNLSTKGSCHWSSQSSFALSHL